MSDLEKMRAWIATFVDSNGNGVPDIFQVDFTSEVPQNAGLFPTGTMEVARTSDIVGNTTITNQYNFALYTVLEKPDDHDDISTSNAQWIMDFQQWVQEQSVTKQAPTFGNVQEWSEIIKAQNGQFYGDKDSGVGVYMVTITAQYKKYYKSEVNRWAKW